MRDWFVSDEESDLVFGLDPTGEGQEAGPPGDPAERVLQTLLEEADRPAGPVTIDTFDRQDEMLALIFPDTMGEVRIETRPTRDRQGTEVLLNGWRMATLRGVTGLAPWEIEQVLL